jgi:hypothetical protein
MFTLRLHYPDDSAAKGAVEVISSSYIPQIGMEIYSKNSSAYRVTNVLTAITNGVLSAEINVLLEAGNG